VVWANRQFATVFFSVFLSFAKATGRNVRPIWTNEGSKRIVPRKERAHLAFWGLNDVPLNYGVKSHKN